MPSCTLRGHPGWQRAPSLPLLDLPHSQHSAHVVLAGTACRRRGPPGHASASLVEQAGGTARRPSSWLGGPPRALSGLPDPWDPRRGPGRAWARGPRHGCLDAKGDIARLIRSHAGGSDKARHSAQARARHTGSSAYGWLDYAMIRSMSRRCRFRSIGLRPPLCALS